MNLTKAVSIIILALIFASLAGCLTVAMSNTMAFSISNKIFELPEGGSFRGAVAEPSFSILHGDPINDPKPN